jgi:putative colanic acid biosynthesis acetyltransferase WcaF
MSRTEHTPLAPTAMPAVGVRPRMQEIDSPHGVGNRIGRLAWGIAYVVLFRPSPRNLHRWRNWLLRLFGAKLHPTARVYPRARIWAPWNLVMHKHATLADDVDAYCADIITIGEYSTVSQYSYLCGATHDFESVSHPLITRPITIGRRCWIAADVFVAPGMTIGDGTVVGARSSVFKDLPAWMIAMGSPAEPIRPRRLGPADFGENADQTPPN